MARMQYWPATGQYWKFGIESIIDEKNPLYQEQKTGMHQNI